MSSATATYSTSQHNTRINAKQPLTQPQSALGTRHGVTSERVSSGHANGCGLRVGPRRPLDHQTSKLVPEELGSCGLRAPAAHQPYMVRRPPKTADTAAADRRKPPTQRPPTAENRRHSGRRPPADGGALRTASSGYFR